MAKAYQPKRFTDIGLLKRIDFPLLIRLLECHKSFFDEQEGFVWAHDPTEFPFDVLAKILMSLNTATPINLLEVLYFVERLADDEYFDDLLKLANRQNVNLDNIPNPTVTDLVLLLCLECPDGVGQFHADIYRDDAQKKAKRFESYFPADGIPQPMQKPTKTVCEQMETELNSWAKTHKRGIGMWVFIHQDKNAVWFMIRHGQPMKRENTVEEDGSNGLAFYRPEKFDVAIYYPDSGELAIGVRTKGQKLAYAHAIGLYCFGNENYFSSESASKYTLDPLLENGVDALFNSLDIPEIEKVTLYELHIAHENQKDNLEIRRNRDLFRAFEKQHRDITTESEIELFKAKLIFHFSDKRTRIVTLELPNIAIYDREVEHDLIHGWLMEHGFILVKHQSTQKVHHERPRRILETA